MLILSNETDVHKIKNLDLKPSDRKRVDGSYVYIYRDSIRPICRMTIPFVEALASALVWFRMVTSMKDHINPGNIANEFAARNAFYKEMKDGPSLRMGQAA